MADGRLSPLPGLARRALAAPSDRAQQLPDPRLAIANAKLRFDEDTYTTQRPQPHGVPLGFRPGFQGANELLQLASRQVRGAPHAFRPS
jgi:hypothetical protein